MKKITKIILAVSMLSIGANANEWRDAKISETGQKMWNSIGYTDIKEVRKWGTSEWDFNKAKKWSRNGIKSHREASKWTRAGVPSPSIAKRFKKNGFTVEKIRRTCQGALIPIKKFLSSNIHTFKNKCIMGGFKISSVEESSSFFGGTKIEAFAYNVISRYGKNKNGDRAIWITAKNKDLVTDFVDNKVVYGLYKIEEDIKSVDLVNGSSKKINVLNRIIAFRD